MTSRTMLLALPILLQVLGVNAAGFADILLRDIVLPRSPAGALVGDAFGIFDGSPTVEARALPSACSFVLGAIDYCSSVSPGWITAPAKTQATCLCYSSASWAPSIFDNSVYSCTLSLVLKMHSSANQNSRCTICKNGRPGRLLDNFCIGWILFQCRQRSSKHCLNKR